MKHGLRSASVLPQKMYREQGRAKKDKRTFQQPKDKQAKRPPSDDRRQLEMR